MEDSTQSQATLGVHLRSLKANNADIPLLQKHMQKFVGACKGNVWNHTQGALICGIAHREFALNLLHICLNSLPGAVATLISKENTHKHTHIHKRGPGRDYSLYFKNQEEQAGRRSCLDSPRWVARQARGRNWLDRSPGVWLPCPVPPCPPWKPGLLPASLPLCPWARWASKLRSATAARVPRAGPRLTIPHSLLASPQGVGPGQRQV